MCKGVNINKLENVKLLIIDVDGVLTDGKIIYDNADTELKCFDVKDGLGLSLLHKAGIKTAIVTGRESKIVEKRARELHFTCVYQNVKNKLKVFNALLAEFSLSPDETCYVGDDLPDLPVIVASGVGIAVADAVDEVKNAADFVCSKNGGNGAIREVAEQILKAQGKWDDLLQNLYAK
ncbi:MAG: HAD-IIIA family hydrolase [Candidatus Heimdallarchaeota archaeon]|nr:HAD-IIIA family hydrolase [Candidatus Heimdallarchaeota archaeon]